MIEDRAAAPVDRRPGIGLSVVARQAGISPSMLKIRFDSVQADEPVVGQT